MHESGGTAGAPRGENRPFTRMKPRNLADPDYEPTDDELRELMRGAYADAIAGRDAAHRELRQGIAEARAEAIRRMKASQQDK